MWLEPSWRALLSIGEFESFSKKKIMITRNRMMTIHPVGALMQDDPCIHKALKPWEPTVVAYYPLSQ